MRRLAGRGHGGGRKVWLPGVAPGPRGMAEQRDKLRLLRRCQDALDGLRLLRGESATALQALRELFDDPWALPENLAVLVEFMDHTANTLQRGNQLINEILRDLLHLEDQDPSLRSILMTKLDGLEASGRRALGEVRRLAELADPALPGRPGPRGSAPAPHRPGSVPMRLPEGGKHLDELEAIIAEGERLIADLEGFLSLRERDLEFGATW